MAYTATPLAYAHTHAHTTSIIGEFERRNAASRASTSVIPVYSHHYISVVFATAKLLYRNVSRGPRPGLVSAGPRRVSSISAVESFVGLRPFTFRPPSSGVSARGGRRRRRSDPPSAHSIHPSALTGKGLHRDVPPPRNASSSAASRDPPCSPQPLERALVLLPTRRPCPPPATRSGVAGRPPASGPLHTICAGDRTPITPSSPAPKTMSTL